MQTFHAFLPSALDALPRAGGPDLTRYFLACGLILAAIVGLAFGFRRLFADSLRRRAARRSLRIVDVLPLGGKQRLSVVRCYDRTFALGIGEKEVTLVAELDAVIGAEAREADPLPEVPEVPEVTGVTGATGTEGVDFARLLETAKDRIQSAMQRDKATPRRARAQDARPAEDREPAEPESPREERPEPMPRLEEMVG